MDKNQAIEALIQILLGWAKEQPEYVHLDSPHEDRTLNRLDKVRPAYCVEVAKDLCPEAMEPIQRFEQTLAEGNASATVLSLIYLVDALAKSHHERNGGA